jgi:parallel beta-helix repeat protein
MMREMKVVEFVLPAKYGESATLAKRQERSTTMRKNRVLGASVSLILLTFFLLPAAVHAQPCTAVVVGGNSYTSINDALAGLAALNAIGQTGPGTIIVTGTCTENVSINDARSITIVAPAPGGASMPGGATIVGPLDSNAFDIFRSQGILLRNLEIKGTFSSTVASGGGGEGVFLTQASEVRIFECNIHDNQQAGVDAELGSLVLLRNTTIRNNTPNDGLDLFDNSTANVAGTTIQNNGDSLNGGVGVFVGRNSTVVFRQTNLIQNNADIGIQARNLSNVAFGNGVTTIQGHLTNGIILQEGSHLQVGRPGTLIQDNGDACPLDPTCGGIFATQNSTVDLAGGTVSGNHGSGVSVEQGANAQLSGVTVSNNTGDGVHLQWISIGNFLSGNTVTGNGGASVSCDDRSLAIGDLSAFSKVRCGDVERPEGAHHGHEDEDKDRHR